MEVALSRHFLAAAVHDAGIAAQRSLPICDRARTLNSSSRREQQLAGGGVSVQRKSRRPGRECPAVDRSRRTGATEHCLLGASSFLTAVLVGPWRRLER